MKPIVFCGPSLTASDRKQFAKHVEFAPPVAMGELLMHLGRWRKPRQVLIIDGYFERMAAIWHKEILLAIERGHAVHGAASMGALRAAELEPFGMIGHGQIFKQYSTGEIVADDEVCVAHLDASRHYQPISLALVNLRTTVAAWRDDGLCSQQTASNIIGDAQRTHYRNRTMEAALGFILKSKRKRAEASFVDQKRQDALTALHFIANAPAPAEIDLQVPRTWALSMLAKQLRCNIG